MRQLTKKQKKILDNYRNISRLEDLPDGVFEQLEKINDTEILWSETNRYLNDNYLKDLYGNALKENHRLKLLIDEQQTILDEKNAIINELEHRVNESCEVVVINNA
jgi:predicted AlkP superfamily phosphohydrolase/phosphomutase